jgi:hypothetical protein
MRSAGATRADKYPQTTVSGREPNVTSGLIAAGADPIAERPGFKATLERIAGNGVRCIIVESPDRFARDLTVQLTGHDFLKSLGIALIPATSPDHFVEDTPTAVLVRQVLGAIAQFEKTSLVAKLKAARDRKPCHCRAAGDQLMNSRRFMSWMWTLIFEHHREAAMAAFAKSWRRE